MGIPSSNRSIRQLIFSPLCAVYLPSASISSKYRNDNNPIFLPFSFQWLKRKIKKIFFFGITKAFGNSLSWKERKLNHANSNFLIKFFLLRLHFFIYFLFPLFYVFIVDFCYMISLSHKPNTQKPNITHKWFQL